MRKLSYLSLIFVLLFLCITPRRSTGGQSFAQGGARPPIVVVEGGTLIDGNGGTPVRDVQIVIQGNRITGVGRKGQNRPPNAQVVNADGKHILPGLWDAQMNYYWYHGETFLNNGVTSFVGIGDNGEAGVAYGEAFQKVKIRAPRPFDWAVHFVGPNANANPQDSPFHSPHPLQSVDDARSMAKRVRDPGGAGLTFQNGGATSEMLKAVVQVAHALGKPIGVRAGGPNIFPPDAAMAGADFIPRSQGVAQSVTNMAPPQPGAGPGAVNELDQWAEMDERKAADLIKILVQTRTALVPNFFQKAPGLPKRWTRFELQDRKLFSDPFLMAYYPNVRAQVILWNYNDPPNLAPDVIEQRTKGYKNALRFHKMLIDAGGRVVVGTDGGQFNSPGLGVHHEMEIFAEDMNLPSMQVIQAATKWVAEMMKVEKQIGTVETGNLADLLIVDADPLQDIANLNRISNVIADGKVIDRTYHAWYRSPFGGNGPVTIPPVEDLGWALNLRRQPVGFGGGPAPAPAAEAAQRGAGPREGQGGRREGRGPAAAAEGAPAIPPLPPGLGPARQPQPTIETIDSGRRDYADADFSKYVVKEGSPALNLKLTGFNYFQRSQVYFNGIAIPTRVVSRVEIEATIDENLLRSPGRYQVVVKNLGKADPANLRNGDGTSNNAWLIVNYR